MVQTTVSDKLGEGNRALCIYECNGGRVIRNGDSYRFSLSPAVIGYTDAQLDDYSCRGSSDRRRFMHGPGTSLHLRARFSHSAESLQGTAGFGFWNAPFGDPSQRRPRLPQAAWFFFGSAPNDLPFAPESPGRGWFAATVDSGRAQALAMIPVAPLVLLLNQWTSFRRVVWPGVQRASGISYAPLSHDMTLWHDYRIDWSTHGCIFRVDGHSVLETAFSPRGPLGFVCWIDNQYLVLSSRGKFRSGIVPLVDAQTMEVSGVRISPTDVR